jgi:3,4-dihydroxy 2-butanone 4-phosphate synthase / GTP cyclohydrolase II
MSGSAAPLGLDAEHDPTPQAIASVRAGKMIVLTDGGREANLMIAAQHATADAIAFMLRHGRGFVRVAMLPERLSELGIPPMTSAATEPRGAAVHISVDHVRDMTTRGVSAREQAATIRALANPLSRAAEFRQPGHVFPLAYRDGGVLRVPTEMQAAVDIAALAGCAPAGVSCHIVSWEGELLTGAAPKTFAGEHGLPLLDVADLIGYRRSTGPMLARMISAALPIGGVRFEAIHYRDLDNGREHLALTLGDVAAAQSRVTVHSECLLGDAFGSLICDCRERLDHALLDIVEAGNGALVYLRRDERSRLDMLGPHGSTDDERGAARRILADLGVTRL